MLKLQFTQLAYTLWLNMMHNSCRCGVGVAAASKPELFFRGNKCCIEILFTAFTSVSNRNVLFYLALQMIKEGSHYVEKLWSQ